MQINKQKTQNSKTPAHQLTSKTTTNMFTPTHYFISSIQSSGNLMSRAVVNQATGDTSPEDISIPSGGNLAAVQRIIPTFPGRQSGCSPEDNKGPNEFCKPINPSSVGIWEKYVKFLNQYGLSTVILKLYFFCCATIASIYWWIQ